jgi:hypothetical protein
MALFTRKIRKVSLLLVLAIVAFVVLEGIAMAMYPGGTWLDRSSVGHDYLRNFDGALYALHVVTGKEIDSALVPGLQKIAAVSLVAFMLSAAIFGKRTR